MQLKSGTWVPLVPHPVPDGISGTHVPLLLHPCVCFAASKAPLRPASIRGVAQWCPLAAGKPGSARPRMHAVMPGFGEPSQRHPVPMGGRSGKLGNSDFL